MKAPAFLFYAGDFLSSPDVQSMDTREVGAYVLLLLNAWQGDTPGHLLNNEDRIRRITRMTVAEWEVSRDLLLGKFPVADMGVTRYNPRMVAEAEKQAENRAKKAAAGKQGGRPPKKQNESENKQMLSKEKLMLSKPKANDKQTESLSISISTTTGVVEKATAAPRPMLDEGEMTFPFAHSFFNTEKWLAVVADVQKTARYAEADFAHYRDVIRLADDTAPQVLPNRHWRKKLMNWLENDAASKNGIVKPVASSQPKGKADNEITFELNPTAVARRRREAEELEARIITANLDRINRNEGTNFTLSQFTGLTQ